MTEKSVLTMSVPFCGIREVQHRGGIDAVRRVPALAVVVDREVVGLIDRPVDAAQPHLVVRFARVRHLERVIEIGRRGAIGR